MFHRSPNEKSTIFLLAKQGVPKLGNFSHIIPFFFLSASHNQLKMWPFCQIFVNICKLWKRPLVVFAVNYSFIFLLEKFLCCFDCCQKNCDVCRTHRVPTLQLLFLLLLLQSLSRSSIKHQYFHDSSVGFNISYMVGKRTAPGFIWRWQRQRQRHTQRQIQGQRQSFQEESLPVYINLVLMRSNRYI